MARTTLELERFFSDFEKRMAPLERAVDEAWWNLATSGTDETQKEFVHAGKEYNRLFSDQDEYLTLRNWYEGLEGLESPLLRRQVEVLYWAFAERQGDEELLGRIEVLRCVACTRRPIRCCGSAPCSTRGPTLRAWARSPRLGSCGHSSRSPLRPASGRCA